MTETRQQRQARIDAKVADLRARADSKEAESNRLHGAVTSANDSAFWTQPAYGNAAGRSFATQRDRERSKLKKASDLYFEAKQLRERAEAMATRGARMAGDADAERDAIIAASDFHVGQTVRTLYGDRTVVKVNAKSILIEGGSMPIKVQKHLARAI